MNKYIKEINAIFQNGCPECQSSLQLYSHYNNKITCPHFTLKASGTTINHGYLVDFITVKIMIDQDLLAFVLDCEQNLVRGVYSVKNSEKDMYLCRVNIMAALKVLRKLVTNYRQYKENFDSIYQMWQAILVIS